MSHALINQDASQHRDTDQTHKRAALSRGHTASGEFHAADHSLSLAFAPLSDLDSVFAATCLDTGELLQVRGWHYEAEIHDRGIVVSLDGSTPLHRVLHDALAGCEPRVAAVIRDWAHRDPVDAMMDARLLKRALTDQAAKIDQLDVSHAARRAHADWMRDFSADQRDAQAVKLDQVMTEWADAVLDEAIKNGAD